MDLRGQLETGEKGVDADGDFVRYQRRTYDGMSEEWIYNVYQFGWYRRRIQELLSHIFPKGKCGAGALTILMKKFSHR